MLDTHPSTTKPDRLADSVPQAASRLGISESTLRREIKAKRIVAVHARGRTLVTRIAQEAWLSSLPALR